MWFSYENRWLRYFDFFFAAFIWNIMNFSYGVFSFPCEISPLWYLVTSNHTDGMWFSYETSHSGIAHVFCKVCVVRGWGGAWVVISILVSFSYGRGWWNWFLGGGGSITLITINSSLLTYGKIIFGTVWVNMTIWDQA